MENKKMLDVKVGDRVRWHKNGTPNRHKPSLFYGTVRKVRDDGFITIGTEPDGRILLIPHQYLLPIEEEQ